MIYRYSCPSFTRYARAPIVLVPMGNTPPAIETTHRRSATMTRREAARLLGVHERLVRKWVTEFFDYFTDGLDLSEPEIEKLRVIQRMAGRGEEAIRAALAAITP